MDVGNALGGRAVTDNRFNTKKQFAHFKASTHILTSASLGSIITYLSHLSHRPLHPGPFPPTLLPSLLPSLPPFQLSLFHSFPISFPPILFHSFTLSTFPRFPPYHPLSPLHSFNLSPSPSHLFTLSVYPSLFPSSSSFNFPHLPPYHHISLFSSFPLSFSNTSLYSTTLHLLDFISQPFPSPKIPFPPLSMPQVSTIKSSPNQHYLLNCLSILKHLKLVHDT